MAENDRFERSLGAGWRTAANYTENENASLEEIGDKLVSSLVDCLRKYDGVPGFREIVDVLKAPLRPSLSESSCQLEDIVRDRKGHRHSKIAANEAKSLLVSKETLKSEDVETCLAQAICPALVRHYFFARVCPKLTATKRFSSPGEFLEWQIRIEQSIQSRINMVATQLVQSPDATNLRAPRRTAKRIATSELLDEVLVSTAVTDVFLSKR